MGDGVRDKDGGGELLHTTIIRPTEFQQTTRHGHGNAMSGEVKEGMRTEDKEVKEERKCHVLLLCCVCVE